MSENGGLRTICFGWSYNHEFEFVDQMTRPYEDYPNHIKKMVYYLLKALGYDLDEMTGPRDRSQKAELALAKLHNDTHITQGYRDGFNKTERKATLHAQEYHSQTAHHEFDPPGCFCARTWGHIWDQFTNTIGDLNAPAHCAFVLNSALALQHLLFRFDTADKINGKFCKYSKNQVMKFQRLNGLNGNGRVNAATFQEMIKQLGDPDVDDTGGTQLALSGEAPIPEI